MNSEYFFPAKMMTMESVDLSDANTLNQVTSVANDNIEKGSISLDQIQLEEVEERCVFRLKSASDFYVIYDFFLLYVQFLLYQNSLMKISRFTHANVYCRNSLNKYWKKN